MTTFWIALILAVTTFTSESLASLSVLPTCNWDTPVGQICAIDLSNLRPTQQNVGYRAVAEKAAKLKAKSQSDYEKHLIKNFVPLIVGPQGFFMIDRHHQSRAVYELGRKVVVGKIVQNWHSLSGADFWKRMTSPQYHYTYLFDVLGRTIPPGHLPTYLWNMADDPYRSLSGAVQDQGGFVKRETDYYIEFKWALFFRLNLRGLDLASDTGYRRAIKTALDYAHSDAAREMPGWVSSFGSFGSLTPESAPEPASF